MISYKKFNGYDAFKYASGFSILNNGDMLERIVLKCVWSSIVWKDNVRKSDNFLLSKFLVLDFDSVGDETMEGINDSLKDFKRIIATTKSHQKDKGGVTCDRYRLIIPFTTPITSLDVYRYNYSLALKKYWWADPACKDGARFFFPSKEIVYLDREGEYTWDVVDLPCASTASVNHTFTRPEIKRKIPSWYLAFINDGVLDKNNSRNTTLYKMAADLFRLGFTESEIRQLALRAPIKWEGVSLESAIKSAKKRNHNE